MEIVDSELVLSDLREISQAMTKPSPAEKRRTPWDTFRKRRLYAQREEGGQGFADIAEIMTAIDGPMTHTAVHNYFITAYAKVADALLTALGVETDEQERREVVVTPEFQEAMACVLDKMTVEGKF